MSQESNHPTAQQENLTHLDDQIASAVNADLNNLPVDEWSASNVPEKLKDEVTDVCIHAHLEVSETKGSPAQAGVVTLLFGDEKIFSWFVRMFDLKMAIGILNLVNKKIRTLVQNPMTRSRIIMGKTLEDFLVEKQVMEKRVTGMTPLSLSEALREITAEKEASEFHADDSIPLILRDTTNFIFFYQTWKRLNSDDAKLFLDHILVKPTVFYKVVSSLDSLLFFSLYFSKHAEQAIECVLSNDKIFAEIIAWEKELGGSSKNPHNGFYKFLRYFPEYKKRIAQRIFANEKIFKGIIGLGDGLKLFVYFLDYGDMIVNLILTNDEYFNHVFMSIDKLESFFKVIS